MVRVVYTYKRRMPDNRPLLKAISQRTCLVNVSLQSTNTSMGSLEAVLRLMLLRTLLSLHVGAEDRTL